MTERTFTFSVTSPSSLSWLSGKPLNQWFEIPNTALANTPPSLGTSTSPTHPTAAFNGIGGPGAKINAWNGATLRPTGSIYLIAAAGGHGDYGGNEVNALKLNTETPAWVELRPSSAAVQCVNDTSVYLDYRRSSSHTYNTTQFVPQDDRLVILAYGALDSGSIADPSSEWLTLFPRRTNCSFSAVNWEAANAGNDWDVTELSGDTNTPRDGFYASMPASWVTAGFGMIGCTDPVTGDLYSGDNAFGLWRYSRSGGTWTKITSSFGQTWAGNALCVDPVTRNGEAYRRLMFISHAGETGEGVYRDDTGAKLTMDVESGSEPWSVLRDGSYNCLQYDDHNDCFWAFQGGVDGNFAQYKIEYVTPTTYNITKVTVAAVSGSTAPDFAGTGSGHVFRNGIHNSIQYSSELKGFVVADQYNDNVHFMRVG